MCSIMSIASSYFWMLIANILRKGGIVAIGMKFNTDVKLRIKSLHRFIKKYDEK